MDKGFDCASAASQGERRPPGEVRPVAFRLRNGRLPTALPKVRDSTCREPLETM